MRDILPKLEEIIAPVVEAEGCEIVEIKAVGTGRASVLRVFVYRDGGVSIERIARISRKISVKLDEANMVRHRYFLEVSSPGLDRPLRSVRDFARAVSERIRIVEQSGKTTEGILVEVDSHRAILNLDDDNVVEVPFNEISLGKIII